MSNPNLQKILICLGIALSAIGCSGIFNYDDSRGSNPPPPPAITIQMAERIEIFDMPSDAPSGNCIGPVSVYGKDKAGNDSPIASEDTSAVIVAAPAGFEVFQDGSCTVSGPPLVSAGTSVFSFYFRSAVINTPFLVVVKIAGLEDQASLFFESGEPKGAVVRGSGRLGQFECMPAEVQLLDIKGRNVITQSDRTLSLSLSGGMSAASDPGCSSTITDVTVLANQGSTGFYVKTTAAAGSVPVGATGVNLTSQLLSVLSHTAEQVIYDRDGTSSGGLYSYCTLVNGRAKCWGDGTMKRLGDNTVTDSKVPKEVSVLADGVTAVTQSARGGCALKEGAAYCWGDDGNGSLGDGATTGGGFARGVDGIGAPNSGVTHISRAGNHACAIVNGGVKCWGYGAYGAMGNGTTTATNPSPVDVMGLGADSGVMGISVSGHWGVSYAITEDRSAYSWGHNGGGALGIGTTVLKSVPQPILLPADANRVSRLSGGCQSNDSTYGQSHACALVQGSPYCWGDNLRGAVGNGTQTDAKLPGRVGFSLPGGTTFLSTGGYYGTSLALRGGVLYGWGDGQHLSLLNGISANLLNPTAAALVFGQSEIIRTVSGANSDCFLKGDGLFCAGFGAYGQLGNDDTANNTIPQRVVGIDGVLGKISAAGSGTCILWNGKMYCAGANPFSQIGLPEGGSFTGFRLVTGSGMPNNVTHLAYGEQHSCAVASGNVYCLGLNSAGELGALPSVLSKTSSGRKITIPGGVTGAVAVAVGDTHTCAVVSGSLYCWGSNESGQLGIGPADLLVHEVPRKVNFSNPTSRLGTTFEVTDVAAIGERTCALVNGALACWGADALGGADVVTPSYFSGLDAGVSALAVSKTHTCAVKSGKVYCFGSNRLGKLGNDSETNSAVPVMVEISAGVPLRGATAVAVGEEHSCAVAQGKVYCWGGNSVGQLGDPAATSPAQRFAHLVPGTLGAVDVASGAKHACATVNGRLKCWGLAESGQLGYGGRRSLPLASTIALP